MDQQDAINTNWTNFDGKCEKTIINCYLTIISLHFRIVYLKFKFQISNIILSIYKPKHNLIYGHMNGQLYREMPSNL